jgi:broad specificity phosphatase PhoE
MEELQWLAVVRHAESTGNVIQATADADRLEAYEIPGRDADVPLSERGREQAAAVGVWLAGQPDDDRPEVAVVSPYLRARQTAELALAGTGLPMIVDERLRDRDAGVLNLLTFRGVEARLPEEALRRKQLGKLYYRPPGGESWSDVLLRLRTVLRELREDYPDGRVVLFAHEVTVLLVRYLAEGQSEDELMAVAHTVEIANGSISSWRRMDGALRPELFNAVPTLDPPVSHSPADPRTPAG